MRKFFCSAALALCPVFAIAQASAPAQAVPSEASLEQLLTLTHADKLMAGIQKQTRASLAPMFEKAVEQIAMAHPEKREHAAQVFDKFMNQTMDMLEAELGWAQLKPMTLEVYRSTFSQEEVNAMIAFYSSPLGQSVIAKLPVATQKSMQMVQQRMGPLMQRVIYQAQQTAAVLAAEPEDHKH